MRFNKSWAQTTALALSLPTTIFTLAYIVSELVDRKIIGEITGILILIGVVVNTLGMIIWYAIRNSKKN